VRQRLERERTSRWRRAAAWRALWARAAGGLAAWGALALGAAAARADAAAQPLTFADALAAIGAAPLHRAAVARTGAAAAGVRAAGAWPATALGVSSALRTAHLGLTASLPLPLFGTIGANVAVARAELGVATAEAEAVDLRLRRDVARAWLELARAEARADLSARSATREDELAAITAKRFAAGDASRAEVVAADAAARRARARATADTTAIAAASADLAGALGWDPAAPLHAAGGLPGLADAPAVEALGAARAAHPDVRAATARADAEGARVVEARRARWPRLALDLEGMIDDPTLPGSDVRVGVSLEIPFLGKAGAEARAAEARRAAALLERDATLGALHAGLVAAWRRYAAARERARALEEDVLPAQREADDLARAAYREGEGGLVAVLEADRALADVEAEWIEAHADAAGAWAELAWALEGAR